jgi:hypothetical protein
VSTSTTSSNASPTEASSRGSVSSSSRAIRPSPSVTPADATVPRVRLCPALLVLALATGACGGDDDPEEVVILDTKRVERAIEQSILEQRDLKADVDCPSGVHQGKGLTFNCVATTKDGRTTFVVQQKDDEGNVEYAAQ